MIPEKALQYIKDKKLQTGFSYLDVWRSRYAHPCARLHKNIHVFNEEHALV